VQDDETALLDQLHDFGARVREELDEADHPARSERLRAVLGERGGRPVDVVRRIEPVRAAEIPLVEALHEPFHGVLVGTHRAAV
jgi:hypothetical protein